MSTPATLPWSWYADADVLRREQESIFRRFWQYAARADQVAESGSYVASRAG
jgi:phenylpropionate dioxygenase-like ring-hydroxylating dioxygenase large terminal subunit